MSLMRHPWCVAEQRKWCTMCFKMTVVIVFEEFINSFFCLWVSEATIEHTTRVIIFQLNQWYFPKSFIWIYIQKSEWMNSLRALTLYNNKKNQSWLGQHQSGPNENLTKIKHFYLLINWFSRRLRALKSLKHPDDVDMTTAAAAAVTAGARDDGLCTLL